MRRFVPNRATVAAFLFAAVLILYWQTTASDFIAYDDDQYVFDNAFVRGTFSLATLKWAFTTFHAANWHPLTWLSHILDVQLFGMNPAGHHLVNVLLHAANAVLLFLLLNRLTSALWRSAAVAALFALHPLHVESIAWVAERKDVLSTLFYLLTLYFYAGYAERRSAGRYLLVLATLALGLMAKPMLVTVPVVMLLMDYWPLGRLDANGSPQKTHSLWLLVREKIPFLAMIAASAIVTVIAQRSGDALTTLANTPLAIRLGNAAIACQGYLAKMFWPRDLAVFYPYPEVLPVWHLAAAVVLLTVVTIVALQQRRERPYLLVGWLWYLVTLLPVIGIVRVGLQAMADRYTYIPLTGIFIMLVWWIADISREWPRRIPLLALLSFVVLTACSLLTWRQLAHWKNTTTLFSHALDVTRDNYIAHSIIGRQLEKEGQLEQALHQFDLAVEIAPWYEYARIHQGLILKNQGRLDAAVFKYNEAILQNRNSVSGYINLGIVMALQDRLEDALRNFETAVAFDPQSAVGHYNLGLTLSRLGRQNEAIEHFYRSIKIDPFNAECHNNLGIALISTGNIGEALRQFDEAIRLKPQFYDAISNRELARTMKGASR
jgi:Flp pilus assembly protein TadD